MAVLLLLSCHNNDTTLLATKKQEKKKLKKKTFIILYFESVWALWVWVCIRYRKTCVYCMCAYVLVINLQFLLGDKHSVFYSPCFNIYWCFRNSNSSQFTVSHPVRSPHPDLRNIVFSKYVCLTVGTLHKACSCTVGKRIGLTWLNFQHSPLWPFQWQYQVSHRATPCKDTVA